MADVVPSPLIVEQLKGFYHHKGYVRRQSAERLANRRGTPYKKGDEVRLVADSKWELSLIRSLLRKAGFKIGRPFAKDQQWRQPIYGRDQVARFLEMVGADAGT